MKREAAKHSPFLAALHVMGAGFTLGAEETDIRNVSIQLKDADLLALTAAGHVEFYLSDDADGNTLTATAATSIAVGTNGLYIPQVTAKAGKLISESNGLVDLNIEYTGGAKTWYVVILLPNGEKVVSSALTFAA